MSDFEVGAVYWPGKDTANIEVLQIGYPELSRGSADVVSKMLSACNIDGEVKAWSLHPSRSHFFSGFPKAEEWEDRWCKGWTLRVEFNRVSETASTVYAPAIPVDVCDPTSVDTDRVREESREKFTLIAKAEKLSAQDAALAAERFLAQTNARLENFKVSAVFQSAERLFLKLVFPRFNEAEEQRILGFLSKLKRRGYLTHWEDLLR
jgi:hypothetical protein